MININDHLIIRKLEYMKFVDEVKVFLEAGKGGDGCYSFLREKYRPKGGPDGGDGGNGGDIVFQVDSGLNTLLDLQFKQYIKGKRGAHGKSKGCHGKCADSTIVKIPPGTIIKEAETELVLADLTEIDQSYVALKGGKGGKGSSRYSFSQLLNMPKVAEEGNKGESKWLKLELKLIADVGLIGMPNAGKSTLISRISAAKPKIADYPFTTLVPNLGVVKLEDYKSFVVADIPGLINGAHEGYGLGDKFLRHIERSGILVHLLQAGEFGQENVIDNFNMINKELMLYCPDLIERQKVVVLNKTDIQEIKEQATELRKYFKRKNYYFFAISAATGAGVDNLVKGLARLLAQPEVPIRIN